MEFTALRSFIALGFVIAFGVLGVMFYARYNDPLMTLLSIPMIFFCATLLGIGVVWAIGRIPEMLKPRESKQPRDIV
jgi:TRAP-type C4-dicarboxylate transport system permease small subunit